MEASKSLNAKTPVLRDTPFDLPSSAFLPCLYNSNGITNITCTWLQKDMFMSFYTDIDDDLKDTEMEDCGLIDITDKCIHINISPFPQSHIRLGLILMNWKKLDALYWTETDDEFVLTIYLKYKNTSRSWLVFILIITKLNVYLFQFCKFTLA